MKKYQINDTVFYGTNGVCRISAIERHSFNSEPDDYYILNPIYTTSSTTIFVPFGNPELCGRMRPLMTKEQLLRLISVMTDKEPEWIEDNNQRRTIYGEILQNAEPEKVLSVLRALYARNEELRKKKKRLHVSDERLFRDAERMLNEEIAYVVGVEPEEVVGYISREVERLHG